MLDQVSARAIAGDLVIYDRGLNTRWQQEFARGLAQEERMD